MSYEKKKGKESFQQAIPNDWAYTPVVGKAPKTKEWQKNPFTKDEVIRELEKPGSKWTGIGALCGAPSGGLLFVDHDGESCDRLIEDLSRRPLEEALPKTVMFTSGRPGRFQSVYRVPSDLWDEIQTTVIKTGVKDPDGKVEQLELRWDGCQSVVCGIHPETKQPYQWINSPTDTPIAKAPMWMISQMAKRIVEEQPKPRAKNTSSLPMGEIPLTKCLSKKHRDLILNGAGDGERNVLGAALARDLIGTERYLQAIGRSFEGDARSLFDDYCSRCTPPLTEEECETIWNSALKDNPSPCLSEDKIQNCIDAHHKKGEHQTKQARPPLTDEECQSWDLTDVPDEKINSKLMQTMREVKSAVAGNLRLNEMELEIEFHGKALDSNAYKLFISKLVDIDRPKDDCAMILSEIAKKRAYHPVQIWLEELNEKYGETTIDYLDSPASRYLRTKDPLYDRLLRIQLIAAVKRIFEPGCKFDNAVVLQGSQGIGKSTFWNVLAGDAWFDDNLGEDVENKDSLMILHGCWFEEWGEIDRITGKKEMGVVKSFMSRRVDTFRAPYERSASKHPRRCVIVGSVNPDQFLKDDENRRFWVIPVEQKIDVDAVIRDRKMLWAAAVALYKKGEDIFLSHEDEQRLRESNKQFATLDAWEEVVTAWVDDTKNTYKHNGKEYVRSPDILIDCLGKTEIRDHSGLDRKRIADILRRRGFKESQTVRLPTFEKPQRAWCRPITDPVLIAALTPEPTIATTQDADLGVREEEDGVDLGTFHNETNNTEMGAAA
jgi:predicted P-loop ATPase